MGLPNNQSMVKLVDLQKMFVSKGAANTNTNANADADAENNAKNDKSKESKVHVNGSEGSLFQDGDAVEANYHISGDWYPGHITRTRTFPSEGSSSELIAGEADMAEEGGKAQKGLKTTLTTLTTHYTYSYKYDVHYDDGEDESNIEKENVRIRLKDKNGLFVDTDTEEVLEIMEASEVLEEMSPFMEPEPGSQRPVLGHSHSSAPGSPGSLELSHSGAIYNQ